MGDSRTTGAAERRRRRRSAQRRVQLPPPLRRKEQKAKKTRPHRPELHLASGVSTADSAASAKNVGAPRSVLTSGLGASAKVGRVRFVSLCAQNERMPRTWVANRLCFNSDLPRLAHAHATCASVLVYACFVGLHFGLLFHLVSPGHPYLTRYTPPFAQNATERASASTAANAASAKSASKTAPAARASASTSAAAAHVRNVVAAASVSTNVVAAPARCGRCLWFLLLVMF